MCQINQVLDESGGIVYSLAMGIYNRVLDKQVLDKSDETVYTHVRIDI